MSSRAGTVQSCDRTAQSLKRKLQPALPGGLALAGLAICTWGAFRLDQSFAFTGFVHLVIVVLAAVYGGFWQATFVSVVAVTCLNYFFVPPIFSFVNSPANWVALGAFEFTALVISRLSLRAQLRGAEAVARQGDLERLYETSRRILLLGGAGDLGSHITSLVREVFGLEGVQLFDARTAAMFPSGASPSWAAQKTRDAYLLDTDCYDAETRSWYGVVRLGVRPVGGLSLHGTSMSKLAATALASLCGIAIERRRALEGESHALAARQAEQLRTAVLDALAHDFKTPLAIARTASSGLLAIGDLSELQTDLVASIDQQVTKLDQLASRLLTAARLESAEYKPQRESVLFSSLVHLAIQGLSPETERARFHVSRPRGETPILADRELILTSIVQLVRNAVQYSEPGSLIDVRLTADHGNMALKIRSRGIVVEPHDCKRIFERFYRARGSQTLAAGTGLGLSIVKKIVEAHHGSVWAESERNYGTSFAISLPAIREALVTT